MNKEEIIQHIDAEISRLTQARNLLANAARPVARSLAMAVLAPPKPRGPGKKRTISAEGRARIAAAQKRRWAKQRAAK